MERKLTTVLLSLLTPGLGYLQCGNRKSFYTTLLFFFSILFLGTAFRLFTSFLGLAVVIYFLIAIYISAAIDATVKTKAVSGKTKTERLLKVCFTVAFLFITGISFANRRTIMGFDIMSMNVPVMQPAVLQGDRFLVDTWVTKTELKRGAIVVHSFRRQKGLYLNRIIGMSGDTIEIKEGSVFVNGQILNEPYVQSVNVTKPESKNMKATVIPRGLYFVMGDNRDASFGDSRFSGTITINNVVGRAKDIIWSKHISRVATTLR